VVCGKCAEEISTINLFIALLEFSLKIMASRNDDKQNIPELIYDVGANVTYRKGRFFGKARLFFFCLILVVIY
jgi:hypothetical protein